MCAYLLLRLACLFAAPVSVFSWIFKYHENPTIVSTSLLSLSQLLLLHLFSCFIGSSQSMSFLSYLELLLPSTFSLLSSTWLPLRLICVLNCCLRLIVCFQRLCCPLYLSLYSVLHLLIFRTRTEFLAVLKI